MLYLSNTYHYTMKINTENTDYSFWDWVCKECFQFWKSQTKFLLPIQIGLPKRFLFEIFTFLQKTCRSIDILYLHGLQFQVVTYFSSSKK